MVNARQNSKAINRLLEILRDKGVLEPQEVYEIINTANQKNIRWNTGK